MSPVVPKVGQATPGVAQSHCREAQYPHGRHFLGLRGSWADFLMYQSRESLGTTALVQGLLLYCPIATGGPPVSVCGPQFPTHSGRFSGNSVC